jgi:hypothetical protein
MPRDMITSKFLATITITVVPLNQYGDQIDEGSFTYTTEIQERKMSGVMARLERINDKGE